MASRMRGLASGRAKPIDGKAVAKKVLDSVKEDVAALKAKSGYTPGLAVIIVGERPDSHKYVSMKEKLAAELGFNSYKAVLPEDVSSSDLLETIETFNENDECDGILLQLPLPEHLSTKQMLSAISPSKDVDGFHPMNAGRLASWRTSTLSPCTPRGVMEMLDYSDVSLVGKHVAVVGESNVVGLPLALMLLEQRATVSIVHQYTVDPATICRAADVVISAAGVARLVESSWIKPGAVVIDVGINFAPDLETGKVRMCGDVHPDVWNVASQMSPVPGGVGPMTVAMLMRNTVDAALMKLKWFDLLMQRCSGAAASAECAMAWLDADGDGQVSFEELRAAFSKTGDELSDEALLELLQMVDTDGDGKLSGDEIEQMLATTRRLKLRTAPDGMPEF